jgi:hypothetical protein
LVDDKADGSPLRGVSAEDFATLGLDAAPTPHEPVLDPGVAEAIARRGSEEARQVMLAKYTDPSGPKRLVWAVNWDPDTVIGSPPFGGSCWDGDLEDLRVAYAITLIDAVTGEFVVRMERSARSFDCTATPAPY